MIFCAHDMICCAYDVHIFWQRTHNIFVYSITIRNDEAAYKRPPYKGSNKSFPGVLTKTPPPWVVTVQPAALDTRLTASDGA